jgi:hypothetical protein
MGCMETRTGKVVEVGETGATIEMEDGTRSFVEVPHMDKILIEVGMSVSVTEVGDGKPIYAWGI